MRSLMIDVIKKLVPSTTTIHWTQSIGINFPNEDLIKLYQELVALHVCSIVRCCNEDVGIDSGTSRQITHLILEEVSSDDSEIFDIR